MRQSEECSDQKLGLSKIRHICEARVCAYVCVGGGGSRVGKKWITQMKGWNWKSWSQRSSELMLEISQIPSEKKRFVVIQTLHLNYRLLLSRRKGMFNSPMIDGLYWGNPLSLVCYSRMWRLWLRWFKNMEALLCWKHLFAALVDRNAISILWHEKRCFKMWKFSTKQKSTQ